MEKKLKSSKATNAGSFFNSQPTSHDLHAPPACQANMPASQPQQHSHPQQQQKQMEQQHASEFPLKEVLLASGVLSVIGMFYFYKKKQTVPFKTCYGLMWPTLGGGTILAVTPSPSEMTKRLEQSRAVTSQDLRKQKEANAATIDAMMKQYAHKQT